MAQVVKRSVQELREHKAQLVRELAGVEAEIRERAGETDDDGDTADQAAADPQAISPGPEDAPKKPAKKAADKPADK